MSNIMNYMMQEPYINKKAYDIAKTEEQLDDYRISYKEFSKYKYVEHYINGIDINIIKPLLNEISIENLNRYFYLCLTLNQNLNNEDIENLLLDLDFFDYNLIVLNTILYIKEG